MTETVKLLDKSINEQNLYHVFFLYSCGVKWDGDGEDPMLHISYVLYIYMFGFIFPVSIILTCYVKIIKTIKFTVSIRNFSLGPCTKTKTLSSANPYI